ncbi:MAG: hypothetical protein Q8936_18075 [Bacillota bacterium]|nr:hypothetical protein [Bacillota bacterium]
MNKINTKYGVLIPQYETAGERRKMTNPISYFKSGNLKSISLQDQTEIATSIGTMPAEYITFHENGNIKRIFPLNGRLSAYWTEDDEFELSEPIEFDLSIGKFKQHVISVRFYEDGAVYSITFWPNNAILIDSPAGKMITRIGVSFYENGKLKSLEPNKAITVKTAIGDISAYDTNALGLHADSNSLNFTKEGNVKSLITSYDKIEVTIPNGERKIYKPDLVVSIIDDMSKEIIPLKIEFVDDKIRFNDSSEDEYVISECSFEITNMSSSLNSACSACSSCASCSGGCS